MNSLSGGASGSLVPSAPSRQAMEREPGRLRGTHLGAPIGRARAFIDQDWLKPESKPNQTTQTPWVSERRQIAFSVHGDGGAKQGAPNG